MRERLREQIRRFPGLRAVPRTLGRLARRRAEVALRARGLTVARLGSHFAKSPRLASVYYALAPHLFGREHAAVLAGKHEYERLRGAGQQRYLLRRNIHMLEKGLSMRPRRDVFALDYIGETIDCYRSLVAGAPGGCAADGELQWANDVLAAYFNVVARHPVADRARQEFVSVPLGSDPRSAGQGLAPYRRDLAAPAPVLYEDLLRLAERRRSVRWFEPRLVPRELIDRALLLGGLSPSACNRQPYCFRVFDEPELVQQVASVPMGTRGWAENIPVFVVVVGSLAAFFSERDRHLIYTDGALAIMSFVYALETLGLSSCCINWPDMSDREARMAELLGLRRHERPIMCIAVGYPDAEGLVPFSQKKAILDIARYNFE